MDALKEKYNKDNKDDKEPYAKIGTNGKKNNNLSSIIDTISLQLDNISFGTIGSYFKWLYEMVSLKGMWGLVQAIVVFTVELLQKSQYYPNKFFHYSFGFVTKPFENLTKSTSKSPQSI